MSLGRDTACTFRAPKDGSVKLTSSRYNNLSQIMSVKREIKGECHPLWKRKACFCQALLDIQPVRCVCVHAQSASPQPVGVCWTGCRGSGPDSGVARSGLPRSPQCDCLLDQNSARCSTCGSPPGGGRGN